MSRAKEIFTHYVKFLRKEASANNCDFQAILRADIKQKSGKQYRQPGLSQTTINEEKWLIEKLRIVFYEWALNDVMAVGKTSIETQAVEQANQLLSLHNKKRAQKAANARHDKPGMSRDNKKNIREIWATGIYPNRDICAEKECEGVAKSYKARRNALINTPDPNPWPGRKKST